MMILFAAVAVFGSPFVPPRPARFSTLIDEVGIVADYRPATGRFFFRRADGTDSVPVRIGAVVRAGDQIALPSGASVTIQLAEGKAVVFPAGNSVVPDGPSLGKRVAGRSVEAWLGGLLFAWSPVLVTRTLAHFSLVAAAPLALFLWLLVREDETPWPHGFSVWRAAAFGAIRAGRTCRA